MEKLKVSETSTTGAVLGTYPGAGSESNLGAKLGLSIVLAGLSFVLVVGIARAPQIKDCFENNLDRLDACFGQNVLPSYQFGHLTPEQVLLPVSDGPPVPPGLIPETAPRQPLQLSPIITSQQTRQDQQLGEQLIDRAGPGDAEIEVELVPPAGEQPDTNEPANSGADEVIMPQKLGQKPYQEPHKKRQVEDVFLDA